MMPLLITIVSFISILLVVVVFHELGHLLVAKLFKVKTLEFGIGYPPRIFCIYTGKTVIRITESTSFIAEASLNPGSIVKVSSVSQSGKLTAVSISNKSTNNPLPSSTSSVLLHEGKIIENTGEQITIADMIYSINLIPLGGFVKLSGENDPDLPDSLGSKSAWKRSLILLSGAFMNAIYPILAFAIMFTIPHQVPVEQTAQVIIKDVSINSPASKSGLLPEDIIKSINYEQIISITDLRQSLDNSKGQTAIWVLNRNNELVTLNVQSEYDFELEKWVTGIQITTIYLEYQTKSQPPWTALSNGVKSTIELVNALKTELALLFNKNIVNQITGPIGIAQISGEVASAGGIEGLIILSIIISINLAILNILPIPMLDGGRLLFVLIEMISGGKRVPKDKENFIHALGFVFLITLVIIISMKDIQRIIIGESLLGN